MLCRLRIRVGAVRRRSGSRDGGCRLDLDRRTVRCVLSLVLLIWAGLWPRVLEAGEPVFIGHVVVHTLDVFGPEELKSFLNRGANALHDPRVAEGFDLAGWQAVPPKKPSRTGAYRRPSPLPAGASAVLLSHWERRRG